MYNLPEISGKVPNNMIKIIIIRIIKNTYWSPKNWLNRAPPPTIES